MGDQICSSDEEENYRMNTTPVFTKMGAILEPLEDPNNFRYTMFPITHNDMFEMYKKSQSYFSQDNATNDGR